MRQSNTESLTVAAWYVRLFPLSQIGERHLAVGGREQGVQSVLPLPGVLALAITAAASEVDEPVMLGDRVLPRAQDLERGELLLRRPRRCFHVRQTSSEPTSIGARGGDETIRADRCKARETIEAATIPAPASIVETTRKIGRRPSVRRRALGKGVATFRAVSDRLGRLTRWSADS